LQEAGFDQKQAEGFGGDALGYRRFRTGHTSRLREMELRLDTRFESIKGNMSLLKWMMGALIAIAIANFSKQFF
jgi:hypothetical protein